MKILLLEDNKTLNKTISSRLESKNYKVYSYFEEQEAMDNISEGFSCFILNINIPNVNGLKVLKRIREYYEDIPVLIISDIIEIDIIKESYALGCNDYLKKPFFIDELEIKIDKFCNVNLGPIYFGKEYFYDSKKGILSFEEKEKVLTYKENLIMNLFLTNKNKVVSYENIQNYVWEGEFASLDAIRTLIRRLKMKLGNTYIKASTNRGYFFKTDFK